MPSLLAWHLFGTYFFMTTVNLTRGYVAIVDDEDAERVLIHKWYAHIQKGKKTVYARASIREAGVLKRVLLHRFIMNLADPKILVDHENRDGLLNTKKNLRIATNQQNCASRGMLKSNKTGMRGVSLSPNGVFVSHIRFNKRLIHIGTFKTIESAARSYNEKAKEFFGEFAALNNVGDGPNDKRIRINNLGFYGITNYSPNKFGFRINCNGKKYAEKGFNTPVEAAHARDAKARELFGDNYKKLNFPDKS